MENQYIKILIIDGLDYVDAYAALELVYKICN